MSNESSYFYGFTGLLFWVLFANLISCNQRALAECVRPSWKVVYSHELDCKMRLNHFLLFRTSEREPEIERKNGFCYVREGLWHAESVVGIIPIYNVIDLNIDHVLPYSYIVKQVGCKKARKYFNKKYNLQIVEAFFNKKKSDSVCTNKKLCAKQKRICKLMEEEHGESLNCESL